MPKPTTKPARAPKSTSPAPRPRGRPRGETPPPPVTGVRIPADVLEGLDKIVEQRARARAAEGYTISRHALIIAALREFVAREGEA